MIWCFHVITNNYFLTDKQKEIIEKAMQAGYVTCHILTLIFVGVAGAGKSSFLDFILEKPKKEGRTSTPLAKVPIHVCPNEDGSKWTEIDTIHRLYKLLSERVEFKQESGGNKKDDYTKFLRAENSSDQTSLENSGKEVQQDTPSVDLTDFGQLLSKNIEFPDSENVCDERWIYLVDTGGQSQYQDLLPTFIQHASAAVLFLKLNEGFDIKPTIELYGEDHKPIGGPDESLITNEEIIKKYLQMVKDRENLKLGGNENVRLLFVGTYKDKLKELCRKLLKDAPQDQPQANLVETLAKKVMKEMNGDQKVDKSSCEEDKEPMMPATREKVDEICENVIGKMDAKLNKLCLNLSHKCLKFENTGCQQLMFTIDNLSRDDHYEREVTKKFRQTVAVNCESREVKVPLRWFILMNHLLKLSQHKDNPTLVLSIEACKEHSTKLSMDDAEELLTCLEYLADLNLIHYFPDIGRGIVFTTVQFLLNKASELVAFSFALKDPEASQRGIPKAGTVVKQDWCTLFRHGILTIDLLITHFKSGFTDDFKAPQLVSVFKKLLIFAELKNKKILEILKIKVETGKELLVMPCVLSELEESDLKKKREVLYKKCSSIVIYCPDGIVFSGIFTSLVVYLLNNTAWHVAEVNTEDGNIPTLKKNYVTFKIPEKAVKLTLLHSYCYIEVYVEMPSKNVSICPKIKSILHKGLVEARKIQKCSHSRHKFSFFCSPQNESGRIEHKSLHCLMLNEGSETDIQYAECTKEDCQNYGFRELEKSQTDWFQSKLFIRNICDHNYYFLDQLLLNVAHCV